MIGTLTRSVTVETCSNTIVVTETDGDTDTEVVVPIFSLEVGVVEDSRREVDALDEELELTLSLVLAVVDDSFRDSDVLAARAVGVVVAETVAGSGFPFSSTETVINFVLNEVSVKLGLLWYLCVVDSESELTA